MPSASDYIILLSIVALAASFVVSLLAIGIIAIIKKDQKTARSYFFLWLKIFLILFAVIVGVVTIIFVFI